MTTLGTRSVEAALPHGHHTAGRRIATHVAAEYVNDVDRIMPTVSTFDLHFAMPAPNADGTAIDLFMATTTDEVRTYYEGTRREWNIITSHHLRTVDAPWYSLHDSVGELRILATGNIQVGRTAVLFPAWTDGIIGEITWPQPRWSVEDRRNPTDVELTHMRLHDRYLDRWQAGDVDGVLDLFADVSCSVVRIVELGGERRIRDVARSKDDLRAQLSAPEAGRIIDLELTNLAMSHWYAFAAYRYQLQLPDRRVERELASFYPVSADGRLAGQLAYGFEVAL
jgi:hypothetical protein